MNDNKELEYRIARLERAQKDLIDTVRANAEKGFACTAGLAAAVFVIADLLARNGVIDRHRLVQDLIRLLPPSPPEAGDFSTEAIRPLIDKLVADEPPES